MEGRSVIRLTEWSRRKVPWLGASKRAEIERCVELWRADNNLPQSPLAFEGAQGDHLATWNYVGVVEAAGQVIEIYPKLDRALFNEAGEIGEDQPKTAMASLMWMLEVANHTDAFDADTTGLESAPASFLDLWAILLSRNLYRELQAGLARAYRPLEGNSTTVRGRILFQQHVLHNLNRPDRAYCGWDEFTEDRPLNRILKCACRFLAPRVNNPETHRRLIDSLAILAEVTDVDVATALREVGRIIWDRSMQRFLLPFKLAVRLLRSIGHEAFHGGHSTYVFLLDMNQVFEDYVGGILARIHGVPVDVQHVVGTLFTDPSRIRQKPDFHWQTSDGRTHLADAKYKPFFNWNNRVGDSTYPHFAPDEIRQLITYGLLAGSPPGDTRLQLIYPYLGEGTCPPAIHRKTFAGIPLAAIPLPVHKHDVIDEPFIGR